MLTLLYRPWLCVSEMLAVRVSDINLSAHVVRALHGRATKPPPQLPSCATEALARWIETPR
jgi:site-specific recombinase XerD